MPYINLLDIIYPIGSVYISFEDRSPAQIIGGSWTPIEGRFLRGDTNTDTGGEDTCTLQPAQMPSHSHTVNSHNHTTPNHSHVLSKSKASNYDFGLYSKWDVSASTNGSFAGNVLTSGGAQTSAALGSGGAGYTGNASPGTTSAGSNQPHNNMPRYQNCYMWYRTA